MGIFSVTCKCGNRVSKRARFCNRCGAPTPGGWWKCPGCGKWVGNDVEHCSHCNTRLHPGERVSVAGGVWQKEPSLFAQRIEAGNLAPAGGGSLQVQEGTAAILLEAGEVTHVLEAGLHGIDGLMRKVNWFGAPPPRSVVLVDAGEVIVPLHLENLRTAEHFPLEFYGEAILRFGGDKAAAKAFAGNVLKGARECRFGELAERIAPWIRGAVDEMCTTSTLEDLVRDPERRIRLQERMEARLEEELGACGLEVVRVSSAEFTGEEYEELEEARGDLAVARRTAEQEAAVRRLKSQVEMGRFKDEKELAEYKETLDAEYRTGQEQREREFEELKASLAHAAAMAEQGRIAELEGAKKEAEEAERDRRHTGNLAETEHKIGLDTLVGEHGRSEKVAEAKADAAASGIAADEEFRQTAEALKLRERKGEIRLKEKAEDAKRRKGMSLAELLADTEDAAVREDQLAALKLQLQAGKTPEQLLAEQGIDPKTNSRLLEKVEGLLRESAERTERLAERALDAANEAAKRPGQGANTFVK